MSFSKRKIFFRADGSSNVGLGHVIRTLALAELLRDNFFCAFASYALSEKLSATVSGICDELVILKDDKPETFISYLASNDIVVLDGYKFDTQYQRLIKNTGCTLVSIDDIHNCHFLSDVIINHGMCVSATDYSCEPYTKLYLGTNYLLLRSNFYEAMRQHREVDKVKNLFINLGGSDPFIVTLKILEGIKIHNFEAVHVIAGATNESYPLIEQWVKNSSYKNIKLHFNINQFDMQRVMADSQIAVCTPSGVAYELSATRIGLIVCRVTSNQDHFYKFFVQEGLALGVSTNDEAYADKLVAKVNLLASNKDIIAAQMQKQSVFF